MPKIQIRPRPNTRNTKTKPRRKPKRGTNSRTNWKKKRSANLTDGRIDLNKTAKIILTDFREGKIRKNHTRKCTRIDRKEVE